MASQERSYFPLFHRRQQLYINKGIQLGADGFVAKDAPFADLNNMLLSLISQVQVA